VVTLVDLGTLLAVVAGSLARNFVIMFGKSGW
jgi:hypothetical protein